MKKAQVTIKDIAKALGIAPSTVSRALKDNPDISEATRQAVKQYAKEHHYQPNILASNLRMSKTNTIGVIVPQFIHHFFSCVLSGVEEEATKLGYNLLVAQSDEKYENEVRITESFLNARVCGVISSLAKDTLKYDHYQKLINHNIPIVFYDRICTELNTGRVVVDDYAGAFSAVQYMIRTGCKRIFFYSAAPHLEISKNRKNGYLDALKKHNIPFDESMIKFCDTREQAIDITPELLRMENRPDGFFAINDETATGILYACKHMNIDVPEEVSICGFTDGAIARITDPELTTVEQHGQDVGRNAVALLMDRIDGHVDKLNKNCIVRTNLVIRGTTK